MSSRKFLAVWNKGSLPAYLTHRMWGTDLPGEYRQVEYLLSPGGPFINTGFIPPANFNGKYKLGVELIEDVPNYRRILSNSNSDDLNGLNFMFYSGKWHVVNMRRAGDYHEVTGAVILLHQKHDIIVSLLTWTLDGVEHPNDVGRLMETVSTRPVAILGTDGLASKGLMPGKIYYLIIELEDGTKHMHLVPCIRLIDDKPGFYDKVSGRFLTNAGPDEFILPNQPYTLRPHDDDDDVPFPE